MKNHNIIKTWAIVGVCLFGIALSTTSCSDFLEEELYDRYAKENYFENVSKLDMAVLGVYKSMQANGTFGQAILGFDNDTDITFINGTGFNTGNTYRDIGHYYIRSSQAAFETSWKLFYEGIERANVVLENYQNVPASNDEDRETIARLAAEARFLRGFYHFMLLNFFGDVPLKITASDLSQNTQIPRTPREQTYTQIVKDMEDAIPDLPWWNDPGVSNDCRVHKGAALGILARVYLYRGGYSLSTQGTMTRPENYRDYYQRVLDITETIITDGAGIHELNPSYEQIFRNHCQFVSEPKESMFEVDMYYSTTQNTQGVIGSWNVIATADGVYSRANSFVKCCKFLYDKFNTLDLRREVSVGTYQVLANGNRQEYPVLNSQNWSSGKWRREWQAIEPQKLHLNNTYINYVLLRYSDVLLMRAEALNEIHNGADGNGERDELVNQVRRRGYGLSITAADPTVDIPAGLSKNDFLEYLYEERAREFSFESCIRRFDLIRWNQFYTKLLEINEWCKNNEGINVTFNLGTVLNEANVYYVSLANFVPGCHELHPIPARDLRENPALLPQNNGH